MIFLSYAREDFPTASIIVAKLQSRGLNVWWDMSMEAGVAFEKEIEDALSRSDLILTLWSSKYKGKPWTMFEASIGRRKAHVPILLEKMQVPEPFDDVTRLDLCEWDISTGAEDVHLLNAVRGVEERYRKLTARRELLWNSIRGLAAMLVILGAFAAGYFSLQAVISEYLREARKLQKEVSAAKEDIEERVDRVGIEITQLGEEIKDSNDKLKAFKKEQQLADRLIADLKLRITNWKVELDKLSDLDEVQLGIRLNRVAKYISTENGAKAIDGITESIEKLNEDLDSFKLALKSGLLDIQCGSLSIANGKGEKRVTLDSNYGHGRITLFNSNSRQVVRLHGGLNGGFVDVLNGYGMVASSFHSSSSGNGALSINDSTGENNLFSIGQNQSKNPVIRLNSSVGKKSFIVEAKKEGGELSLYSVGEKKIASILSRTNRGSFLVRAR